MTEEYTINDPIKWDAMDSVCCGPHSGKYASLCQALAPKGVHPADMDVLELRCESLDANADIKVRWKRYKGEPQSMTLKHDTDAIRYSAAWEYLLKVVDRELC